MNERRREREARMKQAEATNDLSWISDLQSLPTEQERQDWLRGEDMSHDARSARHFRRRLLGWWYIGLWLAIPGGGIVIVLWLLGVT